MFALAASRGFFKIGKSLSTVTIGRMPHTQLPSEMTHQLEKEIEVNGWDVVSTLIKIESQHLAALKARHNEWIAQSNAPLERASLRASQGYSVGGLFAENLTHGQPTRAQWKELKEQIDWLHFRQLSYQELSKKKGFIPESNTYKF